MDQQGRLTMTPLLMDAVLGGTGAVSRQVMAVVAVLAAMALVVLDAAMVNVALPSISADLEMPPASAARLVSTYQTALLMALLPCAALGESLGNRRIFLAGLALFATAAAFASSASSLGWLLIARFVQGVGAAAVMALGIALLRQALASDRFGAAIGWNALNVALCSAAGPTLGAFIISTVGWQWLFLVHLPLGLVALVGGTMLPSEPATGRRMDLVGMAICAGAFGSLMFGAESLASRPERAAILLVFSLGAFWTLVRREKLSPSPLFPTDLFRHPPFRLAVLASVCCFTGQAAALLALPFHLQQELGQSPLMTGLYMTAWPLAVALAAIVSGRLVDRRPSWFLCASGAGLIAAGLAGATLLPVAAGPTALAMFLLPCGLGFGLFQVPNNRTMYLSAPLGRSAAAGGMQGTARLTGQTLGAILVTILFAWGPPIPAPRLGLATGALFALLAALVSMCQKPVRRRLAGPPGAVP